MVLKRRLAAGSWQLAVGVLGLAAMALSACLPRPQVTRLPEKAEVAVAFVLDDEHGREVRDVPDALKRRVADALRERNLEARDVPFDSYAGAFRSVRDTSRRLSALGKTAAPYLVLVEAKAVFHSVLNGRYRWRVFARLTAARRDGSAAPLTVDLDDAAYLELEHEREGEALKSLSRTIAERVGALVDDFLGANAEPAPSAAKAGPDAIYFVLVDRFANGDPKNDSEVDRADAAAFHGGDLQGLIDRLDQLQALGVRTVWLSPVFKMRTAKFFGHGAFHGYWTEELGEVEPRFGDLALLRRLSDELHGRGMRLVLDLVLNHVAMDAPLAKEKPEWFHRQGPLEDWNDPVQLVSRDVHGLPDLAQEKPEVYRHLRDASLAWIDKVRPDGFRLDAVKHAPLEFWARFNDDVRKVAGADFLLLGEWLDGSPERLAQAQKAGRFSAMFDFPLAFALVDVFCRDASPLKLAAALSSDRVYEAPGSLVTLLDNHDLPRVATECRGDLDRLRRALTLQLTARGTPALTYGTEAALAGKAEPENRGDMRFDEQPLRDHIAALLAARRAHPSLRDGAPRLLEATETLLAYMRVSPDEAAVIAVNQGAASARIALPADLQGRGRELMTGASVAGDVLEVGPHAVAVVVIEAAAPGGFAAQAARARESWLRGGARRAVEFAVADAEVAVVGSAPELGAWDPARGAGASSGRARVELPAGAVYEFKLVRRRAGAVEWEAGDNRSLFVPEGAAPLELAVAFRPRA